MKFLVFLTNPFIQQLLLSFLESLGHFSNPMFGKLSESLEVVQIHFPYVCAHACVCTCFGVHSGVCEWIVWGGKYLEDRC